MSIRITNRVPKPLLPLFCYLLKMLQSPADKGGDMGHEGLTAGGEAQVDVYEGLFHAFDMNFPWWDVSRQAARRFGAAFAAAQKKYFKENNI